MRKDITIEAQPRETRGKNAARRLRVEGLAPAVLYGAGKEPVSVTISPKEINKILQSSTGHNTIFNLAVKNGETTPVMIIDWLHDPIKENLLHLDFQRIDPTKPIRVKVPVHTTGEAKGVKIQGGLLEIVTREVEINTLPDDIPADFTVDVADLGIGQGIRASALPLGANAKLLTDADAVIVHVVALKAEAAVEGEGGPAEPEVVKKGKKEDAATKTAAKTATKAAAPAKKK
ncbi:50S ribosomal protein L25 [Bryobacterales bacterium F-183]|nr:50S ribosomal protein L25 [Bryobacterales bacterium F-183]